VPRIPAIVRKYSAVATPEGLSPFAAERLAVEEHAKSYISTFRFM
ncbi:35170_t:CDS:1, partial [Racocetra persica]